MCLLPKLQAESDNLHCMCVYIKHGNICVCVNTCVYREGLTLKQHLPKTSLIYKIATSVYFYN